MDALLLVLGRFTGGFVSFLILLIGLARLLAPACP
jgi:hypothetical protein